MKTTYLSRWTVLLVAVVIGAAGPRALAGQREWATAGKVLAGVVGGSLLLRALEAAPCSPGPVVVSAGVGPVWGGVGVGIAPVPVVPVAPMVMPPPVVVVAPAPVVYAAPVHVPPPVVYVAPAPVIYAPVCYPAVPGVHLSLGYGHSVPRRSWGR